MERSASYGSAVIAYTLVRAPRGSLSITVRPDGSVTVVAPEDAEPEQVDERVRRRARWILRQQRRFAEFRPRTPARRFVGGETHRYLGRQYRLKIDAAESDRVVLRSGRLIVETRFPEDAAWTGVLVRRWMRVRAHKVLRERYEAAEPVAAALGIRRPRLMICPMRRRWGSHTPTGRILLNDRLVGARKDCIDYVIVHELCHVVEPSHSMRFFGLLRRHMPDWERRKELLEQSML